MSKICDINTLKIFFMITINRIPKIGNENFIKEQIKTKLLI